MQSSIGYSPKCQVRKEAGAKRAQGRGGKERREPAASRPIDGPGGKETRQSGAPEKTLK